MRPPTWQPPTELSAAEQAVVRRIRRAKLFVFLREQRHLLFDEAFQTELAAVYADSARGQPPIPPAQLALATILQAYTGVSDDEVIEATTMDRRWQLVLDCLDCEHAPFSKGTLVAFRQRLIAATLDRRLLERTVALAESRAGFSSRHLRVALDSSPLWGAGRVEDTVNLLGHAVRKAVGMLAAQQGRELPALAHAAGADLLSGSSLKAALDLDWTLPDACTAALTQVLATLDAVEQWLAQQTPADQALAAPALAVATQVQAQDVTSDAAGRPCLRQGVAKDRRISVEDAAMRHGRKSRSVRINGFKRHALHDLDLNVVRAVGLTRANVPEATVTDAVDEDLAAQQAMVAEAHIDRAYLSSRWVRERPADRVIYCKAWPVRNGDHFVKTAFVLDWEAGQIRCPNGVAQPFTPGGRVQFPAETCAACPLRRRCTTSGAGRSVSIHADERLLAELRERQATAAGRVQLRERVEVEHTLAHLGFWQGDRARYLGERKNLFDLRRVAVVYNLHVIARLYPPSAAAA